MQKFPLTLFSVGCCLLIVVLIFGWIIIPLSIHNRIENEMYLDNGTALWEQWTNPDKDSYYEFYIFNVTNPKEIENGGEPIVKELGPYVYKERKFNQILERSIENDTLKYSEIVTYYFDDVSSIGAEDDEIVILNIPYLAIAQELTTYPAVSRWVAAGFLNRYKQTVFLKVPVKEFLFTGTYLPFVNELQMLTGDVQIPNGTFGLFYGKNGTSLGVREIYSGIKDASRLGETISWNGKTELDFWPAGSSCNMINGSDGTLFAPFLTKDSLLYMFISDLCRSVYYAYDKDVEVKGIPAYRFTPPKSITVVDSPDNRCFCAEEDINNCQKDGVYHLKTCRNYAPILASLPYFINGNVEYIEKFGLVPDPEIHLPRFDVEPTTGIAVDVHRRAQLNAEVKRLPNDRKFSKIQDMVFPILWMDYGYQISEENAAKVRANLVTPIKVIVYTKWIVFTCSFFLIFLSLSIFVVRIRRKPVFV